MEDPIKSEPIVEEPKVDVQKTVDEGRENFSKANPPSNKDDWNKLREENPQQWQELSQQNVDKLFREKKELEEKTRLLEDQKNNLSVELESYRTRVTTPKPVIDEQTYSIHNLPNDKAEWENLMIDDPVLGYDLRTYYNNQLSQSQSKFEEARTNAQRIVQSEHPEMYMAELDESGQPRKDDKGKIVLKRDASGNPFFNHNSEKGKLWTSIYNESGGSLDNLPDGPEILMERMQRRLKDRGQAIVERSQAEREELIRQGQVIPEGVSPPPKVDLTFKNDEERAHAQAMVNKRLYNNLEDYVVNRDKKDIGFYEENSMPNFSK